MPLYKKRSFGIIIMILLMLIGSLAGCFKTVSGLYDDVIDIFEDGVNDDDECIEIAWVPIAELYRQLQSGMLKDAKTIIALQHVLLKNSRYHAK